MAELSGASSNESRSGGKMNSRSEIASLIIGHDSALPRKKRLSAEERLAQIVDVAVKLIGQKGYFGMSLQDIADEIGISQTAIIHHVKSKQGLLILVIERYYDQTDSLFRYVDMFRPGGEREGQKPKIPEMLLRVVEQNAAQPELVQLFEVLNSEAVSPQHPAHAYFAQRPDRVLEGNRGLDWATPPGVDAEFVMMLALATMYGLEVRWLSRPSEVDFVAEWKAYSDYLFPLPLWEGLR